ncbi:hypothetical protein [Paenibacillus sp. YN15]|uniref:hypothetical protein n=1 Tax=Paenibacillus sp. YN15 TaxID=1742774 RepID=UPI000DCD8B06|nr:hypothetical protein [Paenibacillus sp. YN15]RAU99541.1 hypothetical protein DQG13_15715 [Paenibacillus sp. YN15]
MLPMGTKANESKRAVLCGKGYVFLDGRWRHKGGGPGFSDFPVQALGDAEFAESLDRYVSAVSRKVNDAHLGKKLFVFKP